MFEWLFSVGAKAILGIFGDSILKPILSTIQNRQNTDAEKFKAQTGADQATATDLIRYRLETNKIASAERIEAMKRRVWWIAWGLFVFPVGLYHAAIYVVSTLDAPIVIQRVPPVQEQWGVWIVLSIFGAHVTDNIITTVVGRLKK